MQKHAAGSDFDVFTYALEVMTMGSKVPEDELDQLLRNSQGASGERAEILRGDDDGYPSRPLPTLARSGSGTVATLPASRVAVERELSSIPGVAISPAAAATLVTHPDLSTLVRGASVRLPAYFPESEIRLDLSRDPQWPEPGELVLGVVTDMPLADALARMDRFADAWWLDAMPAADGLLTITVRRP